MRAANLIEALKVVPEKVKESEGVLSVVIPSDSVPVTYCNFHHAQWQDETLLCLAWQVTLKARLSWGAIRPFDCSANNFERIQRDILLAILGQ